MNEVFLTLLDLQGRIMAARRPIETAFLAVDLVHTLVPYRQAALWGKDDGVVALSGAATVEAGSPYVLWLGQMFRKLSNLSAPTVLTARDLTPALEEQWADWLPA
ncbi:Membrane-fusion protein (fragment) [Magnetospirillum sp. XM-1]|uniref:hypothetical protein n=1 Tax=Magnetospirillum sp. XM-1 TaxID=1663591 RepID=UPI00073DD30F